MRKLASIFCVMLILLTMVSTPASARFCSYGEREIDYPLAGGTITLAYVPASHHHYDVPVEVLGKGPGVSTEHGEYGTHHYLYLTEPCWFIIDSDGLKGDVVIPDTIEGIPVVALYFAQGVLSGTSGAECGCFWNNPEMTSLTLPSSVKYLTSYEGNMYFGHNEKLEKIYGLSQLGGLSKDMFSECPKLNPFEDTYGHWGESAIKWSYDEGLFKGVGLTKFSPNGKVTRGMITSVLYRWEGSPAVSDGTSFPDVRTGVYYTVPVKWAAENGIVSGYENGKFGPNDNVTREQLAAILYRYAKAKGASAVSCDLSAFTDCGKISSYAREAMEWAVGTGIISGKDNGKLDPKGFATRAEAAAIIFRIEE